MKINMSIKVTDKELPRECPSCKRYIPKHTGYVDYLTLKLHCRKCFMGLEREREAMRESARICRVNNETR